jgi:hypothetical protein
MTVQELIHELQFCDPDSEVNTVMSGSDDPTNYWVVEVEEYRKGSSGYPEGEVLLITSE